MYRSYISYSNDFRGGRWGSRSPSMSFDADRSIDALVLSLRALFDPAAAHGFNSTIALRLGENDFGIKVADGHLHLSRGVAAQVSATLATDPQILAALLYRDLPLDDAVRTGEATITGDAAITARFLQLFPLPKPVEHELRSTHDRGTERT
jgi:alkyl sulfatase BDS1-like metallo-beta-lactamase superfamily hydrolase